MKHDLKITIIILTVFLLSQFVGLLLLNLDSSVSEEIVEINGVNQTVTVVNHEDTAVGSRPETNGLQTVGFLLLGVVIGTLLVLLIIKLGKVLIWKIWFFLAVTMSITIALGVLINTLTALIVALILSLWKIFKPNVVVHNVSEILIYSGIAILIVPMFKLVQGGSFYTHPMFLITILLIIISFYDMWAVWKSKHMVKMANFQAKSEVFAGLFIPYTVKKDKTIINVTPHKTNKVTKQNKFDNPPKPGNHKNAILGGGDIAFPLLFSGVLMETLMVNGISKLNALQFSLITSITTGLALFLLLYLSKKDKFYPAMPFVTAGCLLGYFIVLILV